VKTTFVLPSGRRDGIIAVRWFCICSASSSSSVLPFFFFSGGIGKPERGQPQQKTIERHNTSFYMFIKHHSRDRILPYR
jgi:hypothetical protein